MWVETSPRVGKVEYPLVEDINKDISSSYGFLGVNGMTKRGIVIIDPDGVVQYVSVFNEKLGKDVNHVLTALKGLKHIHDNPGTEDEFDIIPTNWREEDEAMHINVPEDVGEL